MTAARLWPATCRLLRVQRQWYSHLVRLLVSGCMPVPTTALLCCFYMCRQLVMRPTPSALMAWQRDVPNTTSKVSSKSRTLIDFFSMSTMSCHHSIMFVWNAHLVPYSWHASWQHVPAGNNVMSFLLCTSTISHFLKCALTWVLVHVVLSILAAVGYNRISSQWCSLLSVGTAGQLLAGMWFVIHSCHPVGLSVYLSLFHLSILICIITLRWQLSILIFWSSWLQDIEQH